jgi:hypothetical protein
MMDGSLFSLTLAAISQEQEFRQRHLIYGYTVVGSARGATATATATAGPHPPRGWTVIRAHGAGGQPTRGTASRTTPTWTSS